MKAFLGIEEQIFLNQVAQSHRSTDELCVWFESLQTEEKLLALRTVSEMVQHTRPNAEDGLQAVVNSGLKPTLTPCVLLAKGATRVNVSKLLILPAPEQKRVLVLLMHLFRISDKRRRKQEPDCVERHWWHRDLSNSAVLEDIRRLYGLGKL